MKTRAAQVRVWLVLPPTNLRDCPPFKSERMGAARQVEDRLTDALQDGWYSRPLTERKTLLEMVLQEEPRFALAQYWQGKCFDEKGDYETQRRPIRPRSMKISAHCERLKAPCRYFESMPPDLIGHWSMHLRFCLHRAGEALRIKRSLRIMYIPRFRGTSLLVWLY